MKYFILAPLFYLISSFTYAAGITIDVDLQMEICGITYVGPEDITPVDEISEIETINTTEFSLQDCDAKLLSFATSERGDIRVFYEADDSLWTTLYNQEENQQQVDVVSTSAIPDHIFYRNGYAYGFFQENNQILQFDPESNAWISPTDLSPLPSGKISPFFLITEEYLYISILDGSNQGLWKIDSGHRVKISSQTANPFYRIFELNNTVYRVRNAATNLVLDDLNSFNNMDLDVAFEKYTLGLIAILQVEEDLYKYDKSLGKLSLFVDRYTRLIELEVPGTIVECSNFDSTLFCLVRSSEGNLLITRVIDGKVIVDAKINKEDADEILATAESILLGGLGEARFLRVLDSDQDTIYAVTDGIEAIIVNKKTEIKFGLNKSADEQSIVAAGIRSNGDIAVDYIYPKNADETLKPLPKYIEEQQALKQANEEDSSKDESEEGAGTVHWALLLMLLLVLRLQRRN